MHGRTLLFVKQCNVCAWKRSMAETFMAQDMARVDGLAMDLQSDIHDRNIFRTEYELRRKNNKITGERILVHNCMSGHNNHRFLVGCLVEIPHHSDHTEIHEKIIV